jgi:hypothetical protein
MVVVMPTRTSRYAAWLAAGLLGVVALFQLALVLGAPWGALTQGGANHGQLPASARGVAAGSAVVLVVLALGLLARAGQGPLTAAPRIVVTVLAWTAMFYSAVGLVLNLITPSAMERAVWAPVTAALLALTAVVVACTRRSTT